MDSEGWVDTKAVLAALRNEGLPGEFEHLSLVVTTSDKKRFEFSFDFDRIRARQGHSVTVEADWKPAAPPPVLFHGTVDRFMASILSQGILPQARHHVHLSPDIEMARNVGARRGKPIIFEVQTERLLDDGAIFFPFRQWCLANGQSPTFGPSCARLNGFPCTTTSKTSSS